MEMHQIYEEGFNSQLEQEFWGILSYQYHKAPS